MIYLFIFALFMAVTGYISHLQVRLTYLETKTGFKIPKKESKLAKIFKKKEKK